MRIVRRLLPVLVLLSLLVPGPVAADHANDYGDSPYFVGAYGVFSWFPKDHTVTSGQAQNDYTSGISVSVSWKDVETSDNSFSWTYLDTQCATAASNHRFCAIRVITAPTTGHAPSHVLSAINANDKVCLGASQSPPSGCNGTWYPTPWGTDWVSYKNRLYSAMASHFKNDNTVHMIGWSCANMEDDSWNLKYTSAHNRAWWDDAGYSTSALVNACKSHADALNHPTTGFYNSSNAKVLPLIVFTNGDDLDAPEDGNYASQQVADYVDGLTQNKAFFRTMKDNMKATTPCPDTAASPTCNPEVTDPNLGNWLVVYTAGQGGGRTMKSITVDASSGSCEMAEDETPPCNSDSDQVDTLQEIRYLTAAYYLFHVEIKYDDLTRSSPPTGWGTELSALDTWYGSNFGAKPCTAGGC